MLWNSQPASDLWNLSALCGIQKRKELTIDKRLQATSSTLWIIHIKLFELIFHNYARCGEIDSNGFSMVAGRVVGVCGLVLRVLKDVSVWERARNEVRFGEAANSRKKVNLRTRIMHNSSSTMRMAVSDLIIQHGQLPQLCIGQLVPQRAFIIEPDESERIMHKSIKSIIIPDQTKCNVTMQSFVLFLRIERSSNSRRTALSQIASNIIRGFH